MIENKNLLFSSFEAAKRHLLSNPGGSIVRSDNNNEFYVKLAKNTQQQKPNNIEKKIILKSTIKPNYNFERKKKHTLKKKIVRKESYVKKKLLNPNILPQSRTGEAPRGNSDSLAPGYALRTHAPKESDTFQKQYIEESMGSREDFKKMSNKQFGTNSKNKT